MGDFFRSHLRENTQDIMTVIIIWFAGTIGYFPEKNRYDRAERHEF